MAPTTSAMRKSTRAPPTMRPAGTPFLGGADGARTVTGGGGMGAVSGGGGAGLSWTGAAGFGGAGGAGFCGAAAGAGRDATVGSIGGCFAVG